MYGDECFNFETCVGDRSVSCKINELNEESRLSVQNCDDLNKQTHTHGQNLWCEQEENHSGHQKKDMVKMKLFLKSFSRSRAAGRS